MRSPVKVPGHTHGSRIRERRETARGCSPLTEPGACWKPTECEGESVWPLESLSGEVVLQTCEDKSLQEAEQPPTHPIQQGPRSPLQRPRVALGVRLHRRRN